MEKLRLKEQKYSGRLIVFEGTDGAGKTTLIGFTANELKKKYGEDNVIVTKQPTDLSRKTRLFQKMMYCEKHEDIDYRAVQLLTLSDRIQHNHEVIIPALKQGKSVICDRYIFTSLANMLARGYNDEKWFFDAAKHIVKPNIAFLAYVPPEKAIERILKRPDECNRHLNSDLLKNVAQQFLAMKDYFTVINTLNAPETAFEEVKKALAAEGIL